MPAYASVKGAPCKDLKEPVQSLAVRKGSLHLVFQQGTNGSQKQSHFGVTMTSGY